MNIYGMLVSYIFGNKVFKEKEPHGLQVHYFRFLYSKPLELLYLALKLVV